MIYRNLLTPLLASLALFSTHVSATTITLSQSGSATGIDGGPSQGGVIDGNFSEFDFSGGYHVSKLQSAGMLTERRTIFEFDVPAALKQSGVVIQNATLTVLPATNGEAATLLSDSRLQLYGYSGNGQADTSDFLNTGSSPQFSAANTPLPLAFNIGPLVDQIRSTTARVGVLLTTNSWGGNYPIAGATLVVEYLSPTNTPPAVTIGAPASYAQFGTGAPITFQGTASDPDGDTVGAISWSSNLDGPLGSGSPLTVSSLSIGTHVITASVTDSKGATGQAQVVVVVTAGTPPPVGYCSARGNTSSYEYIRSVTVGAFVNTSNNNGGYADFTTNTAIPLSVGANSASLQPGFMSGTYTENWRVWIDLNRDGTFSSNELLYSGASAATMNAILTIPTGTLTGKTRMRVAMSYGSGAQACGNFSYGEVEDYLVDIGSAPPPPPAQTQYCSATSNNNSYEWITQIQFGSTVRSTGKGMGYNDYTAQPAILLNRGSTSVTLMPGFNGGSYYEHWRVWIDYNRDGVFGTDEVAMAPTESPSAINGSVTVPASALAGTTRMRVSMAYGNPPQACGSFNYGEVEDYAVTIAP